MNFKKNWKGIYE